MKIEPIETDPLMQRREQAGDPARARPLDRAREQRDPDHERDRGHRAQRAHAALPAEHREP